MNIKYLILILIIAWSCKSAKNVTQPPYEIIPVDTVAKTVSIDSIYLITQQGDTLSHLEEEISISMERVLPDTVTIAAVGDIMVGTNFPQ